MRISLAVLAAAGCSAIVAAALVAWLVPPTVRLSGRVRPYSARARSLLGAPVVSEPARAAGARVYTIPLRRAAAALGRLVERSGEEAVILKLRHAGLHPELSDADRLAGHRLGQLRSAVAGAVVAGGLATVVGLSRAGMVAVVILGLVAGLGRHAGRLERAVDDRRLRMRIEIYTVDQLLALRVRAGGGVMQAVSHLVNRGRGTVVAELAEAVRLHRAGATGAEAFTRIARLTPEPTCARTYRLLAVAEERGVDLAAGLLALAEDVRETRREAMKRAATKRRAAMLVPTIALLAPILLLFVAAPLPYLLTGWQ